MRPTATQGLKVLVYEALSSVAWCRSGHIIPMAANNKLLVYKALKLLVYKALKLLVYTALQLLVYDAS